MVKVTRKLSARLKNIRDRISSGNALPLNFHPENMDDEKRIFFVKMVETVYAGGNYGRNLIKPYRKKKKKGKMPKDLCLVQKIFSYQKYTWTETARNLPLTSPIRLIYDCKKNYGKIDYLDTLADLFRLIRNVLEHGIGVLKKNKLPCVTFEVLMAELYAMFPDFFDVLFWMVEIDDEVGVLLRNLKVDQVACVPKRV